MTLAQTIFDMQMSICGRIEGYTPTSLRRLRIAEFFALWRRLVDHIERDKKNYTKDGRRIIWKQATTWY